MRDQKTTRNVRSKWRLSARFGRGLLGAMACLLSLSLQAQVSGYGDKSEGASRGNELPTVLQRVQVDQHLNAQLPLGASFTDETGKQVTLGSYFDGKHPAILALVYYNCPMLCSEEMDGLTSALEMVHLQPGKDFQILVVSIDPSEGPQLAAKNKAFYLKRYGHPETADGWHFLTGPKPSIDALTSAVGFGYVKVPGPDGRLTQFAHASSIELLTSQGKIAQYYLGVEYSPKDILLGLIDASGNKIGSPVANILTYCYHYDPQTNRHSLIVARVVQLGGMLTLLALGTFLFVMFRRDFNSGRKKFYLKGATGAGWHKETMGISPVLWEFLIKWLHNSALFPAEASTIAPYVDALYFFLLGMTITGVIIVVALVFAFSLRYRRERNPIPTPVEGSTLLEATWTIIPLGIFLIVFVWGALLYFRIYDPPVNAMNVYIIGKQWMWKAEHPGGQHEINALHIPVGRPVQLTMISQDVFHSFSIPDFRVKREVIPGRYTTVWFQATNPGTYHLFCTQYCGTLHSGMIGEITALTPDDYERWLKESTSGMSLAQNGERLFASMGCNACHTGNAAARGPNLYGIYGSRLTMTDGSQVLVNDAYLREAILNPSQHVPAGFAPIMPTYQGQMSEDGLISLVEYIRNMQSNYRVQQTLVTSDSNQAAPTTPSASQNTDTVKP